MSNYNKIMAQFVRLGYSDESKFGEYELYNTLTTICKNNSSHFAQFTMEVGHELWERTRKTSDNKVHLSEFVKVMVQAHEAVCKNISELRPADGSSPQGENLSALRQYEQDLLLLTQPFNILLQTPPSVAAQESTSLKAVLLITLILFLLEMIIMFHRAAIADIVAYLSVLAIFILNYFDRHHILLCLFTLAITTLLNFFWIILLSHEYWSPSVQTQYSMLQVGFMAFTCIFTVFAIIGKLILMILLFKERNNAEDVVKTVRLFGVKIGLDTKVRSPISKMFL